MSIITINYVEAKGEGYMHFIRDCIESGYSWNEAIEGTVTVQISCSINTRY